MLWDGKQVLLERQQAGMLPGWMLTLKLLVSKGLARIQSHSICVIASKHLRCEAGGC
jgi:hypothetical protein